MIQNNVCSICAFYAVSPVHAGSGSSLAAVDLPIQRERHTNWPHVQASAVKGAFRAHYRKFTDDDTTINFIFGYDAQDKDRMGDYKTDKEPGENFPGAVSFSDAKLLAFPMRSNIAPFVWVTSPGILRRLHNDLAYVHSEQGAGDIPQLENEQAIALFNSSKEGEKVILEDAVVTVASVQEKGLDFIASTFPGVDKLLIVSDHVFKYCVDSCTEVQTQIKIDSKKGTAQDGALRYQELLPADSLLYSVVNYSDSSVNNELQAMNIKKHVQQVISDFIQVGGDETLGRGICRVNWIDGGAQ